MPRLLAGAWVALRIAFCLMGIYGMGAACNTPLRKAGFIGAKAPPAGLLGLVAAAALAVPLSILGLLHRLPLAVLLLLGAGYWTARCAPSHLRRLRKGSFSVLKSVRSAGGLRICVGAAAAGMVLFLLLSNLMRAVRPNDHLDPLITYAVQPDRWLSTGHIQWLDDTVFSALPKLGEMITLWPASLATSRMDQLSLLQLFQTAALLWAVAFASKKLRLGIQRTLILLLSVLSCNMLIGWASIAKPDMLAVLFFTMAATGLAESDAGDRPLWPYLCFGLAAAVKPTVWIGLPAFALLAFECQRGNRADLGYLASVALTALAVPIAFALRSWAVTGAALYPVRGGIPSPDPEWLRHSIPALVNVVNSQRGTVLENAYHLIIAWMPIALVSGLAIAYGLANPPSRKRFSQWALPGFVLLLAGAVVLRPSSWGAKYTTFALVWLAAASSARLGPTRLLPGLQALLLAAIAISQPLGARAEFLARFVTSSRPLTIETDLAKSPRELHLWMNRNIAESDARVLSLASSERYFCDFPIYCAWRHPRFDKIYLSGNAEEEAEILAREGIDYVYFDPERPVQLSLFNWQGAANAPQPSETVDFLRDSSFVRLLPVEYVRPYLLCRVEIRLN